MSVQVSDKTRKYLEVKERSRVLVCLFTCCKHGFMMESDETVHVRRYCVVEEDTFRMKKWTRTVGARKQERSKFTVNSSEERKPLIKKNMIT